MACPYNTVPGPHHLCSGGFCNTCSMNPQATARVSKEEKFSKELEETNLEVSEWLDSQRLM